MQISVLVYEGDFSFASHFCLIQMNFLDFQGMIDTEFKLVAATSGDDPYVE